MSSVRFVTVILATAFLWAADALMFGVVVWGPAPGVIYGMLLGIMGAIPVGLVMGELLVRADR